MRPVTSDPSASDTLTNRPRLRRQCFSSVSGRPTPREETSSVYAACPMASEASSAADTAWLAEAMSSSSGPRPLGPSPSTTRRTTRRLPAGTTSRASSSRPKPSRTGLTTASIRVSFIASRRPSIRLCPAVVGSPPNAPGSGGGEGTSVEHSEGARVLRYVRAVPDASHAPAARWGRRELLRLGLALPVLAGCSASPALPSSSGSTGGGPAPTPAGASPAPAPTVPAAATAEQKLSAYAGAVLTGPHRKDLDSGTRRLLTFLRDAHADHAVALAGDIPSSRPTTAAPSPKAGRPDLKGLSLGDSLKRLARQEAAQAARQRKAATSSKGLDALLAGSLAVAADSYAAALGASDPPSVSAIRRHKPAPLLSDVGAAQQLVAQLDAVVYGYQLAIGKLKYTSSARKRAVPELPSPRRLLDPQIPFLLRHKADVPAAEPAYAPSPQPRSSGDAGRLVRGMQTRLEPYAGLVLAAAATSGARRSSLSLLTSTSRTARSWGAGLQAWPGWPD